MASSPDVAPCMQGIQQHTVLYTTSQGEWEPLQHRGGAQAALCGHAHAHTHSFSAVLTIAKFVGFKQIKEFCLMSN